jgi:hypothetical protein
MKTAVEWLVDGMNSIKGSSTNMNGKIQFLEKELNKLIEQAKEVERREKAEEYLKGFKDGKEYQIKLDELLHLDNEFEMKLIDKNEYQARRKQVIEQSKEMEEEQIMKTRQDIYVSGDLNNEQYYNQTFKSEE